MRVDTAVTSGGSSGRPPATASGAQETDSQMTVEEGTSAEGGGVGTAGTTDFETDSQATQINQSQQTCIDPPSSAADGTGLCVPPGCVSLRSEPKPGADAAV